MSFLQQWLKRHEMSDQDGLIKSRLDPQTYFLLLKGFKTVPLLALMAGHNLGMTGRETMHLGIQMNPDSEMAQRYPFTAQKDWYNKVKAFDAEELERTIYGVRKEKRIRQSDFCAWCGKLIDGKKVGRNFCSDFCRQASQKTEALIKRRNNGEIDAKQLRTCPYCKSLFWIRAESSRKTYCNDICEALAKESTPIMRREAGV